MNAFALASLLALTPAGWGPSGCAAVAVPLLAAHQIPLGAPPLPAVLRSNAPAYAQAMYRWQKYSDTTWHLYHCGPWGETCIGGWRSDEKSYHPWAGLQWGAACPSPVPVPVAETGPAPREAAVENFGVDVDRVRTSARYSIGNRDVGREEFCAAVGNELPDDSAKPFLTVIGGEESCNKVLADLESHPSLKGVRDRWHVQSYRPDDAMVRAAGFSAVTSPEVYLQKPDGTVLHHPQGGYQGPEALAQAVRKADPAYNPKSDPDLTAPALPSLPPWAKEPWVWAVAAGVLVYLLSNNRKK